MHCLIKLTLHSYYISKLQITSWLQGNCFHETDGIQYRTFLDTLKERIILTVQICAKLVPISYNLITSSISVLNQMKDGIRTFLTKNKAYILSTSKLEIRFRLNYEQHSQKQLPLKLTIPTEEMYRHP